MVRPARFGYNSETAVTNTFQQATGASPETVQQLALEEFDAMADLLRAEGVKVIVIDDTAEPHTPDSIFPNNWISMHESGHIILYPMLAPNRRRERRIDIIEKLKENYTCHNIYDLSSFENEEKYLEGTGSIVLDHRNRAAYASRSPRTNEELFRELCIRIGYKPLLFSALDRAGSPIYHTNVVMCIGDAFAVICTECIPAGERETVINSLREDGKAIITITLEQVESFAGNMYELVNNEDERLLLMSTRAYRSLGGEQLRELEKFCRIIHTPLHTIESHGGGSARCMVADVRLPGKT
jgi:hypothetical protein